MREAIILELEQVPPQLRGVDGYMGRHYAVTARESFTVPADAGLWEGGSRDTYLLVELATGRTIHAVAHEAAPWAKDRKSITTNIPPGAALVLHSIFRGKDMGLVFHVHPDSIAPMLPAPSALELSLAEQVVLSVSSGLIPKARREYAARAGVDGNAYESALLSLQGKGLMSANKALTVKGKNAVSTLPRQYC
jgi:hypothetical protein